MRSIREAGRFIASCFQVATGGGQLENRGNWSLRHNEVKQFLKRSGVLGYLNTLLMQRNLQHLVVLIEDPRETFFAQYVLQTREEKGKEPREILRLKSGGSFVVVEAREGGVWTPVSDLTNFIRPKLNGVMPLATGSQYMPEIEYALDLAFPPQPENPQPNGETLA